MQGILSWAQIAFAVLFLKVITSSCGASVMNLAEGNKANLAFPYDCNSTEVTLQHGYKAPFYRSRNSQSTSLAPYPERRFVVENKISSNGCAIHLTINPLHRSDAGTYITQVYKDGNVFTALLRIGLNVDYPPGKAYCEWNRESKVVNNWGLLQCSASAGNLLGHFECYQRGERLPPYTEPTQTQSELEQTIWVRFSHPVTCCSSTQKIPKDQCECNDFTWDPSNKRKSKRAINMIDACLTTTLQVTTITVPQSPVFEYETSTLASPSNSYPVISYGNIEESFSELFKWFYVMLGGLSAVIVFCLITCVKLCHLGLNKPKKSCPHSV